jgi:hypothetical protein
MKKPGEISRLSSIVTTAAKLIGSRKSFDL